MVADVKMERQRRDVEDGASTFANLARQYIKEHAMVRTRGWQNTARYLGLRLDGVIPGGIVDLWGDKSISSITVGDVRDIVYQAQHDVTPGATKSTRRNGQSDSAGRSVVRALSKFFNWVVEHGKLEVSPVAGVKAPKPGQARDRVLSNDEIRKFWSAAGEQLPEFAAPLRLLLLTGCRVNEVAGMRRSELSEDLSTWTIPVREPRTSAPTSCRCLNSRETCSFTYSRTHPASTCSRPPGAACRCSWAPGSSASWMPGWPSRRGRSTTFAGRLSPGWSSWASLPTSSSWW